MHSLIISTLTYTNVAYALSKLIVVKSPMNDGVFQMEDIQLSAQPTQHKYMVNVCIFNHLSYIPSHVSTTTLHTT